MAARITIDGRPLELDTSSSILEAMERADVRLPQLCHDARVAPAGACRLCLVEVAGIARPMPACTTSIWDGMEVSTRTRALETGRREILETLAQRLPATIGFSPLLDALHAYRVTPRAEPLVALVDDSHPYIHVDMTRCIDCFLCQRICSEVQGQDTWNVVERGGALRLVPDAGAPLGSSSCVSCGACADACPSGAIEDRTIGLLGRPDRFTRTTCAYCGVGCELDVGVRGDQIVQIRPTREAPVNKGHLCVKGRYAFGYVDAPDRVTAPMIRRGDRWHEVSWDVAIAHVASELTRLRDTFGPDALAVLGSARATNEDNYVAQKLARVVLGTNNVDCCARVCHAPSAAALAAMFGTGAATSSFDDIEQARTIVVIGANSTESHPIVGARIRQAARHGAKLVVLDPRRTELAAMADLHLQPRIGTDLPLLHAIAQTILAEELLDARFVRDRVSGVDELRACVSSWTPERAGALCGVDPAKIVEAARRIAGDRPALFFHGLGVTEHVQGTETVMCVANLALLTGNVGAPGSGVNPLRGQNNVQGAAHMGCEPHRLTGYVRIEEARARFEAAWNAPLPARDGLDLIEMIDAADRRDLKGLWAIGYDVLLTNPEAERTRRALGNLELLVIQDLFFNETARAHGTVFLPVCSSFEKNGTFMNAERRIQRVRAAIGPRGESRPDWQVVCQIAAAMGHAHQFGFESANEIWDEVRQVWPVGRGITYERIERGGLQWPCPDEHHPGTTRLHTTSFASAHTARLHAAEYRPSTEVTDADYPFALTTGRRLYQFNAGTMTARTLNQALQPGDVVEISLADAERLGITHGAPVRLRSRYGEATLPAAISTHLRDGELFATFHTAEVFLNRLVGTRCDPITHTPEYKLTAVCVELAEHR